MIEINLTIVIQVLQFLILVFVLNRLLFRPISQVISERRDKITAWEEKTRTFQDSVSTRLENYESGLVEARTQAHKNQELANNEAKKKEEKNLRAVSEEAARIVASMQQALEEEKEQIRLDLRQQADEMSQMLAEKVLGRKLS